jgi:hypothetical protein
LIQLGALAGIEFQLRHCFRRTWAAAATFSTISAGTGMAALQDTLAEADVLES